MWKTLLFLEILYPGINSEVFELISLIDPLVLGNSFPGNLYWFPGIDNSLFPGNLFLLVFIFHTISINQFRGKVNPQLMRLFDY